MAAYPWGDQCGKNTRVRDWTRNVKSLNLILSKGMNQHTTVHIPVVTRMSEQAQERILQ